MTSNEPLVTVIVPARDEAADIGACIAALGSQDYPLDHLEIVIVDGASEDDTGDVATRALEGFAFAGAAVIRTEHGATPTSLNLGLTCARGSIICRVDARTILPPTYVRRCVEVLTARPDVAVVGGAQRALARSSSAEAVGIARALNNRYVTGLSRYRRSTRSGPSDTVYLGAFRASELRSTGGWDERFHTNQDFELNRRMAAHGTIWFDSSLEAGYLPRSTLGELFRQHVRFGRWKVRYWRMTGDRPQPRQWLLIAGPPIVGASILAWMGRDPRARVPRAALALVGVLFLVEAKGTGVPSGGLVDHLEGAAGVVVVASGWLSGALLELLRARRTRR